ncbi:hypothetical protein ACFQ0B_10620 [Nonomuraea thailandensis]
MRLAEIRSSTADSSSSELMSPTTSVSRRTSLARRATRSLATWSASAGW